MTPSELKEKISNIRVFKRAGKIAPHKALLLLYALGKYQNSISSLVYSEIEPEIKSILYEFGNSRKNVHYPYWRLQQDGIWVIPDADKLAVNSKGDISSKELKDFNITAGFSEDVIALFRKLPELVIEVAGLILKNFPHPYDQDICDLVGLNYEQIVCKETFLQKTNRDPKFRSKILESYQYACALCAFNVKLMNKSVGLEAAHIKWKQADGPCTENNGICMCALHHTLYDRGVFTITPSYTIKVSPEVQQSPASFHALGNYNQATIKTPNEPNFKPKQEFLEWHLTEIYKGKNNV